MTRTPLRVLHVIGGLQLGGAETLLYRLAKASGDRVHHEVICLGERGWYSEPLELAGVVVHHLGMRSALSGPGKLRQLNRLIRASQADVIQSWMYLSNVIAGVLGRAAGIPVVWGIHASSFEYQGMPSRLSAYAGGAAARVLADYIVNCSGRSAEFHARFGYSAAPAEVIHNGYDPEAFFPDEQSRERSRHALGIAPGTFVIGTVARWHSQKDIPNLLAATRLLQGRGIPVMCMLIGGGLDDRNLELVAAIGAAGCGEVVRCLGPRPDTPELARVLELHVLASSGGEAFPNVVAETMLSGTPNVATDVGDSALMAGSTGWIVPPSDPVALADAIEQAFGEWLERPEDWNKRRNAARQSIVDRFTFDKMAAAYERVWRRVAAQS
jgi:glycosyltransferase involved in cell wall biosynthesis